MPYVVLQAYAVVVLLKLAAMHPSRYTTAAPSMRVCGYLLAKVFEHYDRQIFELTGMVSGHTLKHVWRASPVCRWRTCCASPAGGTRRGDGHRSTWTHADDRLSAVAAVADPSRRRSLHELIAVDPCLATRPRAPIKRMNRPAFVEAPSIENGAMMRKSPKISPR